MISSTLKIDHRFKSLKQTTLYILPSPNTVESDLPKPKTLRAGPPTKPLSHEKTNKAWLYLFFCWTIGGIMPIAAQEAPPRSPSYHGGNLERTLDLGIHPSAPSAQLWSTTTAEIILGFVPWSPFLGSAAPSKWNKNDNPRGKNRDGGRF